VGPLLVYVGFALGVSHLCSLLEAALFSSRISTLNDKRSRGSRGAALLLEIKQTRIDDAISAILTLNTVANTLGATLAGAQAARVFGDMWVGVFSGVLTFLILVVSEIIPKTLGAVYAGPLSSFVGWSLHYMTKLMFPVLFVSRGITRLLTRGKSLSFSRGELAAVIAIATREGAISSDESKIFDNLLRFNQVQVGDVMTPRTVVFMLPAESDVGRLLAEPEAEVFSRIPLYRGQPDNVVGYVLQRDVLGSVARGGETGRPLEGFRRPISFIPELASVGAALRQMLERRESIAMVTDEHGGIDGLVTLEDLTETILGVEIIDESDRIVDLRQAAARLRDERLERLRKRRQLRLGETPGEIND
jgi:CBS domain containing-hemolysin-like protein